MLRSLLRTMLIMFPLALLGSFVSHFWQNDDWPRAVLAGLGGLALIGAFYLFGVRPT